MKRFFILISCLLLIVSLSISALAARVAIDWKDYIDYTYPGIDYDINDVFIPSGQTGCVWTFYLETQTVSGSSESRFSYTFGDVTDLSYYNVRFRLQDDMMLDVSSLSQQSSLDVHFLLSADVVGRVRYRSYVYYYDSSGNALNSVESTWAILPSGDIFTIPIDLTSMPSGTEYLSFDFQFIGNNTSDYPIVSGDSVSFTYLGISFETYSPGTLVFDPMIIEPQDYLVNESSNGTTSTLFVSVPAEDITMQWHLLRDDDYSIIKQSYGNPFPVTLDRQEYDYWIDCLVYDKLDITDIVDGSTMTVDFDILPELGQYEPLVGSVRYQVRYFDNSGNLLDNVNFFVVPDANWFDETKLDLEINKPAGAVTMSFYLQFMDIYSEQLPCTFTLELKSVSFVCDIPTMVRVQQETGRTNQLLEEIKDGWEPDPSLPSFNDSLEDSLDKEDQIIDQLDPDGVVGDLDDIQVTVLDRILLLANSFQMISLMFQAFLKVPVLEVVAYVSLLLGLLASLLGIGMAAGRAVSRREARSGKKGK